jgi:transcriptional regulator with XRE-family HTH domain
MHVGKNIGKIRELLGIKQESLAFTLKISQQTISKIEQTANLRE